MQKVLQMGLAGLAFAEDRDFLPRDLTHHPVDKGNHRATPKARSCGYKRPLITSARECHR
jgi:hypothetical protein